MHRLMSRFREVKDGEASMGKRNACAAINPNTSIVWTAVGDG